MLKSKIETNTRRMHMSNLTQKSFIPLFIFGLIIVSLTGAFPTKISATTTSNEKPDPNKYFEMPADDSDSIEESNESSSVITEEPTAPITLDPKETQDESSSVLTPDSRFSSIYEATVDETPEQEPSDQTVSTKPIPNTSKGNTQAGSFQVLKTQKPKSTSLIIMASINKLMDYPKLVHNILTVFPYSLFNPMSDLTPSIPIACYTQATILGIYLDRQPS